MDCTHIFRENQQLIQRLLFRPGGELQSRARSWGPAEEEDEEEEEKEKEEEAGQLT